MYQDASVGDAFSDQLPHISSASDSLHLLQLKALVFPGNAVQFYSSLSLSGRIKKGRIVRIRHNHPLSSSIQVQLFIKATDIPSNCKNNITPSKHDYLQDIPELLQTDRLLEISPSQIIGFVFIFREEAITSSTSQFNPKGMKDYYYIRYRYSHQLNMWVSVKTSLSLCVCCMRVITSLMMFATSFILMSDTIYFCFICT